MKLYKNKLKNGIFLLLDPSVPSDEQYRTMNNQAEEAVKKIDKISIETACSMWNYLFIYAE